MFPVHPCTMQKAISLELGSILATLKLSQSKTLEKVAALIDVCSTKQKHIDGLECRVTTLEDKIKDLSAENDRLKQQNIKVRKSKDSLLEEYTEMKVKFNELVGSDKDTPKLIDKQIALQHEIDNLKAEATKVNTKDKEQSRLREAEMNKLSKENKKLSAKVATLTGQCAKLEEQKLQGDKAMKEELVSWRTRFGTLQEELQKLKDQSVILEVARKKTMKRFLAMLEHKNVEGSVCRETEARKVAELLENVTIKITGDSNFELDVVAFQNLLAAFMVRHTTVLQDLRKQYDALIRVTVMKILCAQAAGSIEGDGIDLALQITHPIALYLFDV